MLSPLLPVVDPEGRHIVKLGRAHQAEWFDAVILDRFELNCISREACELFWGGPEGLGLRVLGGGLVFLDDVAVARGDLALWRPGSRICLASHTDRHAIISFAVHCTGGFLGFKGLPG